MKKKIVCAILLSALCVSASPFFKLCSGPIASSPTVTITNIGGVTYFLVPADSVNAATAEGLDWTVPIMYGPNHWTFGYTGYIPDAVLQDFGGGGYFMFTPEGMLCDNLGFSDDGGTGYGLGTNAFTRPTFIGSFANPDGVPTNTTNPVLWMRVTNNGVGGYMPIYQ